METDYKNIKPDEKASWKYVFRQVLVAFILWTFYIVTGLGKGTPTVAIPQLRAEANSTAAVTAEIASWMASTSGYSGCIGIFIVIPVGHFMGRKFIMTLLSVNTLIACAIIYFSKNAIHLIISQILMGFVSAAEYSVFLLIFAEYSSPKHRGVLLTIKSATLFWGIWIANAIGIFSHYKYIGLVGIICSTCSLLISLFIPESPYWLAYRGRYDDCANAHRWLKGVNEDMEKELNVLIKSQREIVKNKYSFEHFGRYFNNYVGALRQPDIFKPLLLCCLISSVHVFSGKLACAVYAIEMMKKITKNESSVHMGVLVLDGFTVFGMYIGCGLSKILKRRTLLLSTSITGTIFLFAMCIYLYLIKLSVLPENDNVIIAMLVCYSMAVCCGPIILSTSISAELLPMRFRSFCVFIFSLFSLFLLSTSIKVTPYVYNSVGFQGVYLGFGICSTIVITLVYKYIPETKNRTLHEISEIFKPKENIEVQRKLLQRT